MGSTARDTAWIAGEFDRRAERYDDSAMHHWQARQAAAVLEPQANDRILDVAAGTALAARACVAVTGAPQRVVGVDVSFGMLQVATRQSDSHFVQADAARLPFRERTFDAVLCVAAVPYMPGLPAAVREWRRVARPGGVAVFTTPAADGIVALRLIRSAAAEHGVDVPDPNAALGSVDGIVARAAGLHLAVERIEHEVWPDELGTDARVAWDTTLDYGFAEPLRRESPSVRAAVFDTYRSAHDAQRAAVEVRRS